MKQINQVYKCHYCDNMYERPAAKVIEWNVTDVVKYDFAEVCENCVLKHE